jgi:hypothetical protein
MNRAFAILVILILTAGPHCGWMAPASPEETLLAVFREELVELEAGRFSSYAEYMESREKGFKTRQANVNALIGEINRSFEGLSESGKQSYQNRWRTAFQPVVEKIYVRTRELVVRETRELTPKDMARIKELSIRHKALEKETPQASLKPKFFILPEEKE